MGLITRFVSSSLLPSELRGLGGFCSVADEVVCLKDKCGSQASSAAGFLVRLCGC